MKSLSHLNKYFIKYKWYLSLGAIFTVVSNIFGLIPAQLVRYSLDLVKENIGSYYLFEGSKSQASFYQVFTETLLFYGVLILIMALLKGVFLFLVRQTLIVMSRHIEFDLKTEIYQHYQTLPLAFYRQNNTGDLMARISEDVNRVRMYAGPAIMYGMNLIVVFVLVIWYMLRVNTTLTFYVLIPLPILSVSIYFVNQLIIKRSELIQKQLSNISTYVQEAFSGIRVIKAFVKEDESTNAFGKQAENYREQSLKLVQVDSLFSPLIQILVGLSTILVVYIGGNEVMAGRLTIGGITEFIMYVYILTWPVTALGWTTSQIQRAAASQTRINEFLNNKSEMTSKINLEKDILGEVEFKNISFTYPDTGIEALQNFSVKIEKGESIAILGTTGSGKSTLANLVTRMYDVTKGQILIDNHDIKEYQVNKLRGQMGYVPQDVFLFSDTISNNISFGNLHLSKGEIMQAAKNADLYDNVTDFPQRFETVLGERGITLSGGQKQRLSIARAIVREPKIMILDDCLSAVDTKTENAILNNLQKIMKNKTTIIISHRVSSAKLADKIVLLDQGKTIEYGTHAELLAQNGVYKELYEKQMDLEEV